MHYHNERDWIGKINALLSHFMHIPFPEELSDELWSQKYHQLSWLAEQGLLTGVSRADFKK